MPFPDLDVLQTFSSESAAPKRNVLGLSEISREAFYSSIKPVSVAIPASKGEVRAAAHALLLGM